MPGQIYKNVFIDPTHCLFVRFSLIAFMQMGLGAEADLKKLDKFQETVSGEPVCFGADDA